MRHLAVDGRQIVEPAKAGALHCLELARGPTAATSPALAVEVRVVAARGQVVH